MENRDLAIMAVVTLAIWAGFWWQERGFSTANLIAIRTDKEDYQNGSQLKIAIKNNLNKDICFSSCYPYYLEKKDGGWDRYSYSECQEADISEICLSAKQSKFFETNLAAISEGVHRLVVPVCLSCRDKESFKEETKFYSNEFFVK